MTKQEIIKKIDKIEEFVSEEIEKLRNEIESSTLDKDLFSITTYKEVCEQLKEKEESCPYKKIKQIEKLFNDTWKADWKDKKQYKYYPFFEIIAGHGLVFDCSLYGCDGCFGSVSYYKDEKTSKYCGKTFLDIYKAILE